MSKLRNWLVGAMAAASTIPAFAGSFVGDRSDFRDETIYFAMTTRFYDGDPANNSYCWDGLKNDGDPEWRGDFKGLIEKMDYIKSLGFTAIWITPVVENASGLDYHGYHAFDFNKVDPRLESEDITFKKVIDEAHSRGMKVILDIVLQHTGNFGEAYLCPMFKKDYSVNQSNHKKTMKVLNNGKLPANYWDLPGGSQHDNRLNNLKNTRGDGGDPNNYWHHVGQQWDWDDYRRVWGQIAGDCVDLNTENPHVYNYIIDCYTKFINMGVDGFRIDTTGHIARVTFNKVFIPRLHAAANTATAKAARGNTPFFMFGECCAVSEEAIYRGDNWNCSPCFYTWAETKDYAWDENEDSWKGLTYSDCDPTAYDNHPNGKAVNSQTTDYAHHSDSFVEKSDNHKLNGNVYHAPDYSKSSNFNVIDFPMHQRFHHASNAFTAKNDDYLYNDATWNVVYVDSHDYGPNGYKVMSFNPGDDTWAENLSLMFTFRGIPCIFQGTESGFRRDADKQYWIDQGGNQPLANTLRAYYGGYLTGSVTPDGFGEYTSASGNIAATLSHPLARHLMRLNRIRASVPALRKGQYSTEGCSGSMAFKRRYTNGNVDSYVLVCISGNATFTGILNGKYVDAITGDVKNVTDGTLSATCSGKGNMRIYVLNGPGKIGEDGKYLYGTTPATIEQAAYDGKQEAQDLVTVRDTEPFNPTLGASVVFSPNGGNFRSETLTVTATLSEAVSGWYQIGTGAKQTVLASVPSTFTIGEDMNYGETITVKWGATDADDEESTGSVTFKKVDPNAAITIYVTGKDDTDISGTNLHAWNDNGNLTGEWPGLKLTETIVIDGRTYYYHTMDVESVNVIFNRNGKQTGNITGLTEDTFFEYNGEDKAEKIDGNAPKVPSVKFTPAGGEFVDQVTVKVKAVNAVSAWYQIGDGPQISISDTETTFTLGEDMEVGQTVAVSWSATGEVGDNGKAETRTGSFVFKKVEQQTETGIKIFYDNSVTKWTTVKVHYWGGSSSTNWPGNPMESLGNDIFTYTLPEGTTGIVFNNGSGAQTTDIKDGAVQHMHLYKGGNLANGQHTWEDLGEYNAAVDAPAADTADEAAVEYYNIQGIRVEPTTPGFYIMRRGSTVRKIYIR